MKILRSTYLFRNVLIFVLMTLVFVLSVQALAMGKFIFEKKFLIYSLQENFLFVLIGIFTWYMVFNFKKKSEWILLIFIILAVLKSFIFLSHGFNKLILGLNFVFLLFAFYFFTIWELFNLSASHNPNFQGIDLEKKSRFKIKGIVKSPEGINYPFYLTNLDTKSCFVLFEENNLSNSIKLETKLNLEIQYSGVVFNSSVKSVAQYENGMGFEFKVDKNNPRSLSGLYNVCLERGLFS